MVAPKPRGVSVVVCCHNGIARLTPTIQAIACQRVEADLDWELLFVDNASTDGTIELVKRLWPESLNGRLRITHEARPGTGYARWRGLAEARYEYVSFVDDDNWICDGWVESVAKVFDEHSDVGLCGAEGKGAFETEPPEWFAVHAGAYAIGSQAPCAGYVTSGYLWSAGMGIRASAWARLIEEGFAPFISGRKGAKSMMPGEDTEICMAMCLAGWRQWYEPELKYVHYMPAGRLNWTYLRRMYRGFGKSWAAWEPYLFVLRNPAPTPGKRMRQLWIWRLQAACRHLLRKRRDAAADLKSGKEGGWDVLQYEGAIGMVEYLLGDGRHCGKYLKRIAGARWRRERPLNPDAETVAC